MKNPPYNRAERLRKAKSANNLRKLLVVQVINTLVAFGILILFAWLIYDYTVRIQEYNNHVCAVYGKSIDCSTPLGE